MDTARSQAQIGFIKAHGKETRHLSAAIDNDFAAVLLTSLDTQPLARSSRMLLTAGARGANTGMEWNETRIALSNGAARHR